MTKANMTEDLHTVWFSFGVKFQAKTDKATVNKRTIITVYLGLVRKDVVEAENGTWIRSNWEI